MFRKPGKNRRDFDSDGEEERPLPVDDSDYEPKAKKSNKQIWSDVLLEESLESRGARMGLERPSNASRVTRGVETYDVPLEVLNAQKEPSEKKEENVIPPMITVTPANPFDDPFGDVANLAEVEVFGVGPSNPRGNGRGRSFNRGRGRGQWAPSGSHRAQISDDSNKSKAHSSRGHDGRGRGRGPARGFRGNNRGFKRNCDGNLTDRFLKSEYSLETMMSTEFAEGMSLDQLGNEIAAAMGEKDPSTIKRIVEKIGEQKAVALFNETREVEAKGGMKVNDGSRRRTPGGVYICLFKSDLDISVEIKDSVFDVEKKEDKKFKRAKRRGTFDSKLKEAKELFEKNRKDEELKPLPDVTEVMKTDDNEDLDYNDDATMEV